ncbi:MAG: AbrB/MazE/SpoVT family DNA-binding domain-containing protein [Dehalococcoidia bacterium]|nr:MAG: AbrB/MazE/SpoVT family DNA-binding domain-containing protein [Dehalococcoidia bacterium]
MESEIHEMHPVFYGSTTVGERGQVVIPAEARKDMEITPSTKLLVMGGPHKNVLILAKAEYLTAFMSKITDMLDQFKEQV